MKQVQIEKLSLEHNDIVDVFKYYFFGKTYSIVNSNLSLKKKKFKLQNLLKELNDDPIIKNINKDILFTPIEKIIIDKINDIDYILNVKKFKIPFKLSLFKGYKIRG